MKLEKEWFINGVIFVISIGSFIAGFNIAFHSGQVVGLGLLAENPDSVMFGRVAFLFGMMVFGLGTVLFFKTIDKLERLFYADKRKKN